jgi:hypothetical protein
MALDRAAAHGSPPPFRVRVARAPAPAAGQS